MTPEQEHFWNYLKWNPKSFAKETGEHLASIANSNRPYWKRKFNKTANEYFNELMNRAPNTIEVIKIVHIWTREYQLPFDPDKMKSFDRFHEKCNPTLTELTKNGTLAKILSS
jgi:hypothetical protein